MTRVEETLEPIERLVEKQGLASPEEARLRDLVQATRPLTISDELKRGVFASVLRRQHPDRRRRLPMFRPAIVFSLLVAAAATAGATLGKRWAEQRSGGAGVSPATAPQVRSATPRMESTLPELLVELPAVEPGGRRHPSHRARARSEDSSRVVAAVEALRKQRDPDRAARLLAEYLAAHPGGALVEEALALSIEAATARRDPAASDFARRYLKGYPNGRFRRTAEAALARR